MLPINFHRTFVPERRHIGALLHYVALGKGGNLQEMAAETGIPMGTSTGKAPAVLDYAKGMGLVESGRARQADCQSLALTAFGRAVYSEDRYLGAPLTQWLVHMNLCRGDIGARAWRAVFAEGRSILGNSFTRVQLESYLTGMFGPGRSRTGPLVKTYIDDAALGRAGVLAMSGELVSRQPMPILDEYSLAYSATIAALIEALYPGQTQVTLSDLKGSLWFDAALWSDSDVEQVCALLDRQGYVTVDRQMRPWILEMRANADRIWPLVYRTRA